MRIGTLVCTSFLLSRCMLMGVFTLVARQVSEDVTATQCQSRYTRALDPVIRRGPWAPDEDDRLQRAVEIFGRPWTDVCTFVITRSNEQCRDRWQDALNPTVGKGRWTESEDQALLAAYGEFGDRWKDISQKVAGGRTDNMVCIFFTPLQGSRNRF